MTKEVYEISGKVYEDDASYWCSVDTWVPEFLDLQDILRQLKGKKVTVKIEVLEP